MKQRQSILKYIVQRYPFTVPVPGHMIRYIIMVVK